MANVQMEVVQQLLEDGLENLFKSDRYSQYLKMMSKFKTYSAKNTLLILLQCPQATYVAGYQTWKKDFDRHVKKGEKAIKIIAPVTAKQKSKELEENKDKLNIQEEEQTLMRFRCVNVFDISQTEGKELEIVLPKILEGNYKYYEMFKEIFQTKTGYQILEDHLSDCNGYCNYEKKIIKIDQNLPELQKTKTLIHEVTHSLLHGTLFEKADKSPYENLVLSLPNLREVEAESVSYVVNHYLGIDSSEYSLPYIAAWNKKPELLLQTLERVKKVSNEILEWIETIAKFDEI